MDDATIGKGNLAGKGVYANRSFSKGEIVIKYRLEILTKDEFSKLPKSEQAFVHKREGVVYIYSEPERYVNHSDDPNTIQDFSNGCDVAIRDIPRGEMITTDSTKEDF